MEEFTPLKGEFNGRWPTFWRCALQNLAIKAHQLPLSNLIKSESRQADVVSSSFAMEGIMAERSQLTNRPSSQLHHWKCVLALTNTVSRKLTQD